MTQIQIRLAKSTDNLALLALFKAHALHEGVELSVNSQLNSLSQPQKHPLTLFVVEHDNLVQGYMSLVKQYSSWDMAWYLYLDCLFLEPQLRGKGLGKQLVQIATERAQALGIDQIQWQTPVDNLDAIAFYNNIGAKAKQKQRFFLPAFSA